MMKYGCAHLPTGATVVGASVGKSSALQKSFSLQHFILCLWFRKADAKHWNGLSGGIIDALAKHLKEERMASYYIHG